MGRAALPVEVLRHRPCGALLCCQQDFCRYIPLSITLMPLLIDVVLHKPHCGAPVFAQMVSPAASGRMQRRAQTLQSALNECGHTVTGQLAACHEPDIKG